MSKPYRLSVFEGKVIAIDGPAGSGKSTTSKLLASRLGYIYLDTGAMYRAVTLYALKNNIMPEDGVALTEVAKKLIIEFRVEEDINKVYLNGADVTYLIRTPEVTKAVSAVSAHPGVREAMVRLQREIGKKGNVVAEGRDTTSVVFPEADLKIYLDASISERARRRLLDFARMNIPTTIEEQNRELTRRDALDSGRSASPLTRTGDSIVIDTTNLTIEEQVDRIIKLAKSRFSKI
ncbi:Cytidylate kinase [Candidatus Zixiibacteriota bacterium]|nr:Cytidylate kinase [candidate division Zixibacteria bacterium]